MGQRRARRSCRAGDREGRLCAPRPPRPVTAGWPRAPSLGAHVPSSAQPPPPRGHRLRSAAPSTRTPRRSPSPRACALAWTIPPSTRWWSLRCHPACGRGRAWPGPRQPGGPSADGRTDLETAKGFTPRPARRKRLRELEPRALCLPPGPSRCLGASVHPALSADTHRPRPPGGSLFACKPNSIVTSSRRVPPAQRTGSPYVPVDPAPCPPGNASRRPLSLDTRVGRDRLLPRDPALGVCRGGRLLDRVAGAQGHTRRTRGVRSRDDALEGSGICTPRGLKVGKGIKRIC